MGNCISNELFQPEQAQTQEQTTTPTELPPQLKKQTTVLLSEIDNISFQSQFYSERLQQESAGSQSDFELSQQSCNQLLEVTDTSFRDQE